MNLLKKVLLMSFCALLLLVSCADEGYTYVRVSIPEEMWGSWYNGRYYRITESTVEVKDHYQNDWVYEINGNAVDIDRYVDSYSSYIGIQFVGESGGTSYLSLDMDGGGPDNHGTFRISNRIATRSSAQ